MNIYREPYTRIYVYIILLCANGRNLENKNIFSHYNFLFSTPVELYLSFLYTRTVRFLIFKMFSLKINKHKILTLFNDKISPDRKIREGNDLLALIIFHCYFIRRETTTIII